MNDQPQSEVNPGMNVDARLAFPGWIRLASILAVVIGAAAAIIGFLTAPVVESWLWLVVWFLVFGGAAQGVLVWAAIFRVAQARWTPAVNRLGHSTIGFLPIVLGILVVLLLGVRSYVPWVWNPLPEKAAWLNIPFMIIRNLAAMALMVLLSFILVRWSLEADAASARGEELSRNLHYRLNSVAVAITIAYPFVFTLISYDFIMSLWPTWFSTMFGPYYFTTNIYMSLAVLVVMGVLLGSHLRVGRYLGPDQFNDLGNLMLGFSLFSMGLFFAQYLTIWYANLPIETDFIIFRYLRGPWVPLGWAAFIIGYVVPFLLLQSRTLKRRPRWLFWVALLVIAGVALERYVLVVPSVMYALDRPGHLLLFPVSALMGLGFLGALVLAVLAFLRRYPAISAADEALKEIYDREEEVLV